MNRLLSRWQFFSPESDSAPAAPVVEEPVAPAAPLTPEQEEAALDTLIAEKGIDIPNDAGGEKLVPLAAVTTLRGKLKDARAEADAAKAGTAAADGLKARVAELEAQLADVLPRAKAYDVYSQIQQAGPVAPAGPTAEELAELEEIARDEDYYKTDSTLDLDRAKRHRDRIIKAAERIAQQQVAPIQQHSIATQSRAMLASAKLTKAPGGQQPDPEILDLVWSRLDPSVTATREGAIQAWNVAMGYSVTMGKAAGSAAPARDPLPVPLVIEKAGGKDTPAPQATAADERAARDLGIPVADYLKEVAAMPKGWGK